MSNADYEKLYWLVLHRLKGFGASHFTYLLSKNAQISTWFNGHKPTPELLSELKFLKKKPAFDWQGAEKDLAFALQPNSHILTLQEDAYPKRLKQLDDAPAVLFVQGALENLHSIQLAMVGSRHATPQGQAHAFQFAQGLAGKGFTITSGLALGIDGLAHKGALAVGGKTIAVLGQGFPQIYPRRHQHLAQEIVASGGSIVTEHSMLEPPLRQNFPKRNRIISGLSLGVLVVEATLKSGSLITARYALEQNREIFAIPGSINNPLAKGCHALIRQGAKCVETIEHITDELMPMIGEKLINREEPTLARATNHRKEDLSSQFKKVLSQIGYECTPIDKVVERTNLTSQQIYPILSELELRQQICMVSGGYIRL